MAQAKVAEVSERGFIVRHMFDVPADAQKTWDMLLEPAQWWNSAHTWSGDAANLSIDAKAGGCFCEILPNESSPRAAPRGSVEHMRVVYIERPRVLRMSGALGPLQADAVNATLTIQLKPDEGDAAGSTHILLEYVVGGYMRRGAEAMAPAVDAMLGQQMEGLVAKLGGAFARAFGDAGVGDVGADEIGAGEAGAPGDAGEKAEAPAASDVSPPIEVVDPSGIQPLAPEPPKGEAIGR
ncbi:SRPBCC family protein [Novosphingobium profundi]|nr:SRPBCC family protein [Novosphingobium profundi]MBT0666889.1 SRPBCC family protein [Novosphingobium profundi]